MAFLRQVWHHLGGYRRTMLLALACALGHTLLSLVPALFVREVVARISGDAPSLLAHWSLAALMALLAVVYAVRAALFYLDRYLAHVAAWGMLARLRVQVYEHMQGLSHRFFNTRQSGELAPRATHDVKTVEFFLAHGLPEGVLSLLVPLGMTAVLLAIDWRLTLLMWLTVPVLFAVNWVFGRQLAQSYRAIHQLMSETSGLIAESVQGIEVIKAFTYERTRLGLIREKSEALEREVVRVNRSSSVPEAVTQLLMGAGMIIVLGAGGAMALHGSLPLSDLVVFVFYVSQFYQPILAFDQTLEITQDAIAASERVFDILHEENDLTDPDEARHPTLPRERWRVRFDDVAFTYPNTREPALQALSFVAEAGETVALVGHTGAGKTTAARLIPRFWDVDSGSVSLGGVDVRKWALADLRREISIVPQDVFLFNAPVDENIRVAHPGATEADILRAARAANADEFIRSLPHGYKTVVGERGLRLSGGQKQRLAIARALLKNAPVLILDEATSSVDPETEALIQEALERLMRGRTTFVIAHRLGTIERADRILVLAGGKLQESGTHSELLARGGAYAALQRARPAAPSQVAAAGD